MGSILRLFVIPIKNSYSLSFKSYEKSPMRYMLYKSHYAYKNLESGAFLDFCTMPPGHPPPPRNSLDIGLSLLHASMIDFHVPVWNYVYLLDCKRNKGEPAKKKKKKKKKKS